MSHTLEVHFLGRSPHVLELYRMVVAAAGEFGLVVEDSKKTSIHSIAVRHSLVFRRDANS